MQSRVVLPTFFTYLTTLTAVALLTGCSTKSPEATLSPQPVVSVAANSPTSTKPVLLPPTDVQKATTKSVNSNQSARSTPQRSVQASTAAFDATFNLATDKAASATSIAQSAQSKEDWNLAAGRWQKAIALLKTIPASHPKRAIAQKQIAEYQRKLINAQKYAKSGGAAPVIKEAIVDINSDGTITANPTSAALAKARSPEMAVAMHLKKAGAKMYGTYWCKTCQWQREQFGEAFKYINYVECDPAGENARPDLCDRAGITAFPTWEINGRLLRPGGFPLEKLAEFSDFRGS